LELPFLPPRNFYGTTAVTSPRFPNLLLVALDGGGVAGVCAFRVLAELSESAPLPKQIPTLVQSDLERFQARAFFVSHLALRLVAELSLFVHELFYLLQDLCVVHR